MGALAANPGKGYRLHESFYPAYACIPMQAQILVYISYKSFKLFRLSGIIHVLYKAMDLCLTTQTTESRGPQVQNTPVAFGTNVQSSGSTQLPLPGVGFSVQSEYGNSPPPLPPPFERRCPPPPPGEQSPNAYITEEEARMALALTEYFQQQRWVYERVSCLCVKMLLSHFEKNLSKCRCVHVRAS